MGPAAMRLSPRRSPGLAVILTGLLAAAGCSSALAPAALPAKSPTLSAASPSPSPSPAARQQVISSYLAYWSAGAAAERSGDPARARAILAPYTSGAYIGSMIKGMRPYWRKHEVAWGHREDRILKVSIATGKNGQMAAIVVDCQNASHSGIARDGKLLPATRGPAHAKLYASMTLGSGGHWRVANITFVGNSCKA
jgi:hypothetical protein